MSDLDKKRDHVMGLYKGEGWKFKVRKMSDAQVTAIYLREIRKAQERPNPKDPKESKPNDDAPF